LLSFDKLLDFYQKNYETVLETSKVLVELNNINSRNDFNKIPGNQKNFLERRSDSNKWLILKECLIQGECFSNLIISAPHNRIRNSIAHFPTEFDGVKQIIKFIDVHKGIKREYTLSNRIRNSLHRKIPHMFLFVRSNLPKPKLVVMCYALVAQKRNI
jgi:hypothetical protein